MKRFYRYEFFRAFSAGFVSPFISIFALALGASNFIIGYLNASVQTVYVIMQLLLSFFLLRQRKFSGSLMLFISTLSWAMMWIFIGRSTNPIELIILLSIQAIFSASITLSWTILLVNTIPSYKRGRTIAEINTRSTLASMLATLFSGHLIRRYGFMSSIFIIPAIFGLLAGFQFFSLHFEREKLIVFPKQKFDKKMDKDFKFLLGGRAFLNFATGLAAPFLSVYVVTKLGGSSMDVAIISVASSLAYILFYKPWGFVVDFIGRKVTMLSCVLLIATIPLFYALSTNPAWLYFLVPIGTIGWAGFEIASFSYFSDFAKKNNTFQITSLYNASSDFATILGNLFGGLIAQHFDLQRLFILSFIMRFGCLGFLSELKEKKGATSVKIQPTMHPLRYIEESTTLYLILFSAFKKGVRSEFFSKIERWIKKFKEEVKIAEENLEKGIKEKLEKKARSEEQKSESNKDFE